MIVLSHPIAICYLGDSLEGQAHQRKVLISRLRLSLQRIQGRNNREEIYVSRGRGAHKARDQSRFSHLLYAGVHGCVFPVGK